MEFQDIHLEDKATWEQLKIAWDSDTYSNMLTILQQKALKMKQLSAFAINSASDSLVWLEEQGLDEQDFKTDKIKVATEPPSDLVVGEVYFKDLGAVTDYNETGAHYIEPNQKTSDGYDILKYAAQADQIELTYDTARAFGITGKAYTLDEALYAVKQLLDYITTA